MTGRLGAAVWVSDFFVDALLLASDEFAMQMTTTIASIAAAHQRHDGLKEFVQRGRLQAIVVPLPSFANSSLRIGSNTALSTPFADMDTCASRSVRLTT